MPSASSRVPTAIATRLPVLFPLILASLASLAHAELPGLEDPWRWTRFSTASGLPHQDVLDVAETPAGTVWALTRDGPAWFDDFEWHPVGADRKLPPAGVREIVAIGRDSVVVVTETAAYLGNREGFRSVAFPGSESGAGCDGVARLGDLGAVALVGGRLFEIVEGDAVARTPRVAPPSGPIRELVGSARGAWILTPEGYHRWHDGGWRRVFPDFPENARIGRIEQNERGEAVAHVASPTRLAGLWRWDGASPPARVGASKPPQHPRCFDLDSAGCVVVNHVAGELRVRRDGTWLTVHPAPLSLRRVNHVRFGRGGDLWVATRRGLHLWRCRDPHWIRWPAGEGIQRGQFNEIILTRGGTIWIATGLGVEEHRSDGTVVSHESAGDRPLGHVTGLGEDREGGVWISSGGGFAGAYRWDGESWTHSGAERGLGDARFHKIRRDRRGRLWFLGLGRDYPFLDEEATPQPGAFVLAGDRFERWDVDRGLPSGRVYAFAEGPDGDRWFGTLRGLSRWRDGTWTHWPVGAAGDFHRVFTLDVDVENRVWFSDATTGLYLLEDGTVQRYTERDGLLGNRVNDVKVAPDGRVWIGTDSGVSCLADGVWSSLTADHGLSGHDVQCLLPLADRVLISTSGAGINILDPRRAFGPPPRVRTEPPGRDGSDVILRWRASAFWGRIPPGEIPVRYRLDRGAWSDWTLGRSLRIPAPAPGDHEFQVQAQGFLGTLSPPQDARFSIEPPLHLRPAFYLPLGGLTLAVLALGTLILFRTLSHHRRLRESERRLRRSEERLRLARSISKLGDWELDVARGVMRSSEETLRTVGLPAGKSEMPVEEALSHVHELDRDRTRAVLEKAVADGLPFETTFRFRRAGSEEIGHVTHAGRPERDAQGRVVRVFGTSLDVTTLKRLEEQLRQAQKMEAIGQLAGGVAHDFNNLLVAILGHCDLVSGADLADPRTRRHIGEIRAAGQRAEALTRQLLAFGRKQMLRPRVLDLNRVLTDLLGLLRRLIGEDVELATRLSPDPVIVRADPQQIEQVVMNLATNARDAMPTGGTITITTGRVDRGADELDPAIPPGSYAKLTVADSGEGMDGETMERIFEPFFTTKEVGKGTGLGLATAYGIVRQSGGDIRVRSSTGHGTVFDVLLPSASAGEAPAPTPTPGRDLSRGRETILVAEDDGAVNQVVRSTLEKAGYRVLTAEDGESALRTARSRDGDIDLALVDVVMPRMSGRSLAARLATLNPRIRVLFMTGHTEDFTLRHGVSARGIDLIEKPFTPADLAGRIREILDRT